MPGLPDELRRFFADDLGGSLDQLRIALLLRSAPERGWGVESVAATLGVPAAPTGMRLFLLSATGILAGSGAPIEYRYAPKSPRIDAMLSLVDEITVRSPEALRTLADDPPPELRGRARPGEERGR